MHPKSTNQLRDRDRTSKTCTRCGVEKAVAEFYWRQTRWDSRCKACRSELHRLRNSRHELTVAERFWAKVDIRGEDECWPWLAYIERKTGYGMYRLFGQRGVKTTASRIAYELTYGAVADDMDVHHKCRNRACVNPSHLEALTRKAHANRYRIPYTHKNKRKPKTHCKHGHEFTAENTYTDKRGRRACRECMRFRQSGYPTRQRPYRPRK